MSGDTLVHCDVRDDNILLTADGRALLCDWNFPFVGAGWLDAFLLLIGGLRLGEISLLAPFRYSGLLFAVLLGYAVWGHLPDAWGALGLGLLLAAGLMAARSGSARPQP